MRHQLRFFAAIAASLFAGSAMAYVGPGAGISVLGALWGLIIGVVMAVGVILFWPIRMMMRKAKANKGAEAETAASEQEPAGTASGNNHQSN